MKLLLAAVFGVIALQFFMLALRLLTMPLWLQNDLRRRAEERAQRQREWKMMMQFFRSTKS